MQLLSRSNLLFLNLYSSFQWPTDRYLSKLSSILGEGQSLCLSCKEDVLLCNAGSRWKVWAGSVFPRSLLWIVTSPNSAGKWDWRRSSLTRASAMHSAGCSLPRFSGFNHNDNFLSFPKVFHLRTKALLHFQVAESMLFLLGRVCLVHSFQCQIQFPFRTLHLFCLATPKRLSCLLSLLVS